MHSLEYNIMLRILSQPLFCARVARVRVLSSKRHKRQKGMIYLQNLIKILWSVHKFKSPDRLHFHVRN